MIDMIGEKAERLVWMFCVVDRLSVDNDLDAESGTHAFKARPELGGGDIKMNDETWFDFITLTLGDWLEQVEAAALSSNDLFQWGVGDAWGYRRGYVLGLSQIPTLFAHTRLTLSFLYRKGVRADGGDFGRGTAGREGVRVVHHDFPPPCLPILVPEGTSYLCPDCLSIHRDIQD